MRNGISITLNEIHRRRLDAVVADRNTPQKHVWRARIVLMSADGYGTSAIMAEANTSKTTVWRWQARFMEEGVDGLLRDKTRPPGKPPVAQDKTSTVVAMTLKPPPHEATHWTARAMAKVVGLAISTVQKSGKPMVWPRIGGDCSNSPTIPPSPRNCTKSSGSTSARRPMPSCSASMRSPRFRRLIARSRDCR